MSPGVMRSANEVEQFGRTDRLPSLGFGGAASSNLYTAVTDSHAEHAISEALRQSIRYLDTASLYGYGLSEERLGTALARAGDREVTIWTKVGRRIVHADKSRGAEDGFAVNGARAVFGCSRQGSARVARVQPEAVATRVGRCDPRSRCRAGHAWRSAWRHIEAGRHCGRKGLLAAALKPRESDATRRRAFSISRMDVSHRRCPEIRRNVRCDSWPGLQSSLLSRVGDVWGKRAPFSWYGSPNRARKQT
jgi:Aldo/keto reductase family